MDISELKKSANDTISRMDQLMTQIQEERDKFEKEIENRIESLFVGKYNREELDNFFHEPYVIIPKRENEYWVIVPKWIDFQIGWLERSTKSFNIFVLNRYMQWIAPIPEILKEKLKFPEPFPIKVFDGMVLSGEKYQDMVFEKYRGYILRRDGKDKLRIKKNYEFKLLSRLIEDGILPFIPQPVQKEDLREWKGIKLRTYQEVAWKEFLDKGAIGIFWMYGSGKSFVGIYMLARIKGKKLVVVPTLTLKEQWEERIDEYIPEMKHEIQIVTYNSYNKVKDQSYSLAVYDEVHHIPANTYSKLSTINTKYRVGMSGSPFREDKRENYIFALTGFPIGLAWDELLKLQVVKKPTFKVYIVKDNRSKIQKLNEFLKLPLKTIIFCDSIEFGKKISQKLEIPFIYSETKERLGIIREATVSVVSRVGDEGISIPELERVIEVSFLFGSRMQESQRFGRLMHSQKEEPEHIIIMTQEEFDKYQKRLNAIYERGFKIEVIR